MHGIRCLFVMISISLCLNCTNSYSNRDKKYEIRRNFVDIYTNHPYTHDVMDSYKNTDFYKHPKSSFTIHRRDNYYYNDHNNNNHHWRPSMEMDDDHRDKYVYPRSKFDDSKDVLYSDFGVFDNNNPKHYNNNRRNDTKGNYNFVFDNDKNLVYLEPVISEDTIGTELVNNLNNDFDKKKLVHMESQNFNIPNIGVHLSKRPSFQTVNDNKAKPFEEVEDDQLNYYVPETITKKPVRIQKKYDISGNRSKFNDILRKFMIKANKARPSSTISSNNDDVSNDETFNVINNNFQSSIVNIDAAKDVEEEKAMQSVKSKFLEVPLKKLKQKTLSIANKLFSLFTIIQFPNSKCLANSVNSAYEGTCYHANECAKMNGTAMGNCAKGFGVCCVFRDTCGGSSDNNCTYFESPGYPNYYPSDPAILPPNYNMTTTTTPRPGLTPDPRIQFNYLVPRYKRQLDVPTSLSCVFRIYKTNPNVQQIRIDFIDLELAGPTNGTCVMERLVISGFTISNVPVICGYNTGMHVYVDVSGLVGPLQIQVLANMVQRKRFKLRICQYGSSCTGSMGCLQYFTGVSGMISSFNYDKAAIYSRSDPSYFNNLNYAICIRREPGYCSVTYTNVNGGVEYPFQLINFEGGIMTVPMGEAGVEIFNCPDDYIVINGIRLCGYKLNDGSTVTNFSLNAPVTDSNGGPIVIPVRTNGMNVSRGFKLFYMQNRCPT